ncbi:TetR family transcriptional regulator [Orbus wheelerorum]|uniref:TetR family transcriptional regulator n=1 Tax=Orbus wheelerorum TaxID=3074111 RepID=UPI00370DBA9C
MNYLKKNQRYEQILNVAIEVLINEGISAITARKIAAKANIAVGLIHNHFKSIGELKSIALIKVTDQLLERHQAKTGDKTHVEKIINAVSPIHGEDGAILRQIWNEALFLSERDLDIKQAYQCSTNEWHEYVANLINAAVEDGALNTNIPSDLAWRLIALCCGFDNLSIINEFDQSTINDHILALLAPPITD